MDSFDASFLRAVLELSSGLTLLRGYLAIFPGSTLKGYETFAAARAVSYRPSLMVNSSRGYYFSGTLNAFGRAREHCRRAEIE